MSELADEVRHRASLRCEYCRLPQVAFRRAFHIEHIVAKQHRGLTQLDNLALACWNCNQKKGPNLTGIDPETGKIAALFHPRKDNWADHFLVHHTRHSIEIRGVTPTGRATVQVPTRNPDDNWMTYCAIFVNTGSNSCSASVTPRLHSHFRACHTCSASSRLASTASLSWPGRTLRFTVGATLDPADWFALCTAKVQQAHGTVIALVRAQPANRRVQ